MPPGGLFSGCGMFFNVFGFMGMKTLSASIREETKILGEKERPKSQKISHFSGKLVCFRELGGTHG